MIGEIGETWWLSLTFLVVALVYASVGQAGASGYIAAMGLLGMAPPAMKTTALTLNLLVAGWHLPILAARTPVLANGLSVCRSRVPLLSPR